jgi:hypothetical protein
MYITNKDKQRNGFELAYFFQQPSLSSRLLEYHHIFTVPKENERENTCKLYKMYPLTFDISVRVETLREKREKIKFRGIYSGDKKYNKKGLWGGGECKLRKERKQNSLYASSNTIRCI